MQLFSFYHCIILKIQFVKKDTWLRKRWACSEQMYCGLWFILPFPVALSSVTKGEAETSQWTEWLHLDPTVRRMLISLSVVNRYLKVNTDVVAGGCHAGIHEEATYMTSCVTLQHKKKPCKRETKAYFKNEIKWPFKGHKIHQKNIFYIFKIP